MTQRNLDPGRITPWIAPTARTIHEQNLEFETVNVDAAGGFFEEDEELPPWFAPLTSAY